MILSAGRDLPKLDSAKVQTVVLGADTYLRDPCRWGRGTLLPQAPEEVVRQRIVKFLLDHRGWDPRCVSTEVRLVHGDAAATRADIVLYKDPQRTQAAYVIECKAPGRIDDIRTDRQLRGYLNGIQCDGIITDGRRWLRAAVSDGEAQPCLPGLPTPKDLRLPPCLPPADAIPRGTASRLRDAGEIRALLDANMPAGPHLGRKSNGLWVTAVAEFLLHLAHDGDRLPGSFADGSTLTLEADLGWRFRQFGNASGGSYDTFFRCFVFTSRLGGSGRGHPARPIQGEVAITIVARSNGITQLTVLLEEIGRNGRSNALGVTKHQINIDRFVCVEGPWVLVRHNGKVGGARRGASGQEVVEAVRKRLPDFMHSDGRHVVVARLPLRGPQTWTNGAKKTIARIIQYCVLRHEYILSLER